MRLHKFMLANNNNNNNILSRAVFQLSRRICQIIAYLGNALVFSNLFECRHKSYIAKK